VLEAGQSSPVGSGGVRLVVERDDPTVERLGTDQAEPAVGVEMAEHRHAVADRSGVDEQVEVVEQVVGDQRRDQGASAVGDQVATGPGLELVDGLDDAAAGDDGVLQR
jgi:hypothetical protein